MLNKFTLTLVMFLSMLKSTLSIKFNLGWECYEYYENYKDFPDFFMKNYRCNFNVGVNEIKTKDDTYNFYHANYDVKIPKWIIAYIVVLMVMMSEIIGLLLVKKNISKTKSTSITIIIMHVLCDLVHYLIDKGDSSKLSSTIDTSTTSYTISP